MISMSDQTEEIIDQIRELLVKAEDLGTRTAGSFFFFCEDEDGDLEVQTVSSFECDALEGQITAHGLRDTTNRLEKEMKDIGTPDYE